MVIPEETCRLIKIKKMEEKWILNRLTATLVTPYHPANQMMTQIFQVETSILETKIRSSKEANKKTSQYKTGTGKSVPKTSKWWLKMFSSNRSSKYLSTTIKTWETKMWTIFSSKTLSFHSTKVHKCRVSLCHLSIKTQLPISIIWMW